MKKSIILTIFIIMMSPNYALAKAGLLSFGGEEIITIVQLPNDERFQTEEGDHIDIGYIYKSVAILFVPIWNYDARLVGVTANKDTYLNLTPYQITGALSDSGTKLPEKPYLDFWNRIGGKIVFLLVIIFIVGNFLKKKKAKSLYLSALPTARERLKDILINSQEFYELDPMTLDVEGKPQVEGIDFIVAKNYLTSFISVSVFDMNKVSTAQVSSNNDDFFERLIPLRKSISPKTQSSIHYLYFVFDSSPSADDIALLKSLKKRKISKGTNSIPCIIDFEKQEIYSTTGSMPSKKILSNCFIQAKSIDDVLDQEVKI